jgi:Ca2+-binding EF-hand superfamily protein
MSVQCQATHPNALMNLCVLCLCVSRCPLPVLSLSYLPPSTLSLLSLSVYTSKSFKKCDVSNDGLLDAQELSSILTRIGQQFTHEEVAEMIAMAHECDMREKQHGSESQSDSQSAITRDTSKIEFQTFRKFVMLDLMDVPVDEFRAKPEPKFEHQTAAATSQQSDTKQPSAAAVAAAAAMQSSQRTPSQHRSAAERSTDTHRERQNLRELLQVFANILSLNLFKLEDVYWRVVQSQEDGKGAFATYEQFCTQYHITEKASELGFVAPNAVVEDPDHLDMARAVFDLFANDAGDVCSIRQLTIAIASVLERVDSLSKIKFAFTMCDVHESDSITREALIDILCATHLSYDMAQIERKANLVIKASGGGKTIAFSSFVSVAQRFQGALFPAFGVASTRGRVGSSPTSPVSPLLSGHTAKPSPGPAQKSTRTASGRSSRSSSRRRGSPRSPHTPTVVATPPPPPVVGMY